MRKIVLRYQEFVQKLRHAGRSVGYSIPTHGDRRYLATTAGADYRLWLSGTDCSSSRSLRLYQSLAAHRTSLVYKHRWSSVEMTLTMIQRELNGSSQSASSAQHLNWYKIAWVERPLYLKHSRCPSAKPPTAGDNTVPKSQQSRHDAPNGQPLRPSPSNQQRWHPTG